MFFPPRDLPNYRRRGGIDTCFRLIVVQAVRALQVMTVCGLGCGWKGHYGVGRGRRRRCTVRENALAATRRAFPSRFAVLPERPAAETLDRDPTGASVSPVRGCGQEKSCEGECILGDHENADCGAVVRNTLGRLTFSATDLSHFLTCGHLTNLRRQVALGKRTPPPQFEDPRTELLRERGIDHEKRFAGHVCRRRPGGGNDYGNRHAVRQGRPGCGLRPHRGGDAAAAPT